MQNLYNKLNEVLLRWAKYLIVLVLSMIIWLPLYAVKSYLIAYTIPLVTGGILMTMAQSTIMLFSMVNISDEDQTVASHASRELFIAGVWLTLCGTLNFAYFLIEDFLKYQGTAWDVFKYVILGIAITSFLLACGEIILGLSKLEKIVLKKD